MSKVKKLNIEKTAAIIFLAIVFFFFIAIIVRFIGSNVFDVNFNSSASVDPNSQTPVYTDWASQYPFSDKYKFNFKSQTVQTVEKKDNKYRAKVDEVEDKIEAYSTDLLFGRMQFVEMNASINKLVGMKLITGTDSVVVMKNGYLTYQSVEVNTAYAAESTAWFSSLLKEKGINFVYIQSPSKENKFDNQLPDGVTDYYNINADSLLEKLNAKGVNTVDLRPMLNDASDDYDSCFFRTDHHWKPETGVWAAGKIAESLNKLFDYRIDESIGNINNYNVDVYKNYCLGTQGKKVTLNYTDPEDFSLIYPKSETSFTVDYCDGNSGTGTYKERLLDMTNLSKIDYYNISTYSTYLYGNKSLIHIKNNNVSNGKKILYIGDSFCHCVVPCLAMGVENIDVLDIRYFDGSIINYIEKFKPDTVIVNYNPSSISEDTTHNGTFNFE